MITNSQFVTLDYKRIELSLHGYCDVINLSFLHTDE